MLRGKNQIRIGAFHDLPPDGFSSQISDEKKRKALFVQQCREEMKLSAKYLSWIDKDFQLFNESKKVTPSKIEQKVGETIKLTRESGPNIHDASKTTYYKTKGWNVSEDSVETNVCKYNDKK